VRSEEDGSGNRIKDPYFGAVVYLMLLLLTIALVGGAAT
jgi:hypothetical protein